MFLKSVVVCDGLAPFVGKRYGLLMLQMYLKRHHIMKYVHLKLLLILGAKVRKID